MADCKYKEKNPVILLAVGFFVLSKLNGHFKGSKKSFAMTLSYHEN
jgi:hypothetical protein